MKLAVEIRDMGKKIKYLRKEWLVPGVVYGKHMQGAQSLVFPKLKFLRAFEKTGKSTPIEMEGDGVDHLVLVHDYQLDPVSNSLLHVDFLAVNKDEKVEAKVPVILTGVSPFEKNGLWSVQLILSEIEVEALPLDLPHDIKIDISSLEEDGQVIHLSDIDLWDGIEFVDELTRTVVTTAAFKEEEEEEISTEWESSEWENAEWEGVEWGDE